MKTSIAFIDISVVKISNEEPDDISNPFLEVVTKKEGSFTVVGNEMKCGINAIFGEFEPILNEKYDK